MLKRITIAGLLVATAVGGVWVHSATAAKDTKPSDAAAFDVAERAMAKLKIDDPVGLNDVLTAEGLPHNKAALDQLKGFREGIAQRIGKPLGQVELVSRERLGASFVRFAYLERYERSAAVWTITFYYANDHWLVTGLDWSLDTRPYFQKVG